MVEIDRRQGHGRRRSDLVYRWAAVGLFAVIIYMLGLILNSCAKTVYLPEPAAEYKMQLQMCEEELMVCRNHVLSLLRCP
jgi:hypothetical protein